MDTRLRVCTLLIVASLLSLGLSARARAQTDGTGGACIPVSERAGRTYGCFITAMQPVGQLEGPVYWHVESFPTVAAAGKAKGPHGTVVESLGKVWLLTIAGAGWKSTSGVHVAEVGPLPITPRTAYTAQYMEAVFPPGMKSRVHRHSGPEAWYTLDGEMCLETPQGRMDGRAGGSHVIVPGGPPMELTATGKAVRRALVLVLHDSGKAASVLALDWTPKGLCKV